MAAAAGRRARARLTFLARRGGPALAQAVVDGSGCGSVTFSVRGVAQPALAYDAGLFRLAARLSRP